MKPEEALGKLGALVELLDSRASRAESVHESIADVSLRLQQNARELDDLRAVVGDMMDLVKASRAKEWMTTTECAAWLHVHEKTIHNWYDAGIIPGYQLAEGGHLRFDRQEVTEAIKAHREPA